MRFYIPCFWGKTYNFAHSDVYLGMHFAHGLKKLGHDPIVLWGGGKEVVNGVKHENLEEARPKAEDVLFVAFINMALNLDKWPALLRANLKWLYTFSFVGSYVKTYSRFNRVFVESSESVKAFEKHVRVPSHWVMAGVMDEADLNRPSPYPPGGLNLFYAGRLDRWGSDGTHGMFRRLLGALPEAHLWFASNTVFLDPNRARTSQLGVGPWAGEVCYSAADALWEQPWQEPAPGKPLWVTKEVHRLIAEEMIDHPRAHGLGPLAYGSFWDWLRHADCYIDHGYPSAIPPINCKIMDPLRAGCPVVADGNSNSYYLLKKHDAGDVVPFMNVQAMAQAVIARAKEEQSTRLKRALRVREAESWDVRVAEMLALGGLLKVPR